MMGKWVKARQSPPSRRSRQVRRGLAAVGLAAVGLSINLLTEHVAHAASGTWSATADMLFLTTARTATLLGDGRVLVVGGIDLTAQEPRPTPSETYDPTSRTWTRQGDLIKRRNEEASATLLPDGRVLVVGGDIYDGNQTSEVFDPSSGTWTLSGNLNIPRRLARTAALPDGRVLLAGGVEAGVDSVRDVEIYDPASGSWAITGSLVVPRSRYEFNLITLQDGRVLVVGGPFNGSDATWELYDPAVGVWSLAGAIHARLVYEPLPLTLLPDGRVLYVGFTFQNAFLYDPASNTWTPTTGPQFRHDWGTATLLQDGTVLVTATGCCEPGSEVFDPATETWQTTTGDMLQRPRERHTATLLSDGSVVVAGGQFEGPPCDEGTCTVTVLRSVEIFTPEGGS